MQNLSHPILTTFDRTHSTSNTDCCERVSNACLSFLRVALNGRIVTVYDTLGCQQTSRAFPFTRSKVERVAAAVFAFLLLLPVTLFGLAVLPFSKSHKNTYLYVKTAKPPSGPSQWQIPSQASTKAKSAAVTPPNTNSSKMIIDDLLKIGSMDFSKQYNTIEIDVDQFQLDALYMVLTILSKKTVTINGVQCPIAKEIHFKKSKNTPSLSQILRPDFLLKMPPEQGERLFDMVGHDPKILLEITGTLSNIKPDLLDFPGFEENINTIHSWSACKDIHKAIFTLQLAGVHLKKHVTDNNALNVFRQKAIAPSSNLDVYILFAFAYKLQNAELLKACVKDILEHTQADPSHLKLHRIVETLQINRTDPVLNDLNRDILEFLYNFLVATHRDKELYYFLDNLKVEYLQKLLDMVDPNPGSSLSTTALQNCYHFISYLSTLDTLTDKLACVLRHYKIKIGDTAKAFSQLPAYAADLANGRVSPMFRAFPSSL